MGGSFGLIFSEDYINVLLVKRRDIPIWVLPGGGIEKDETAEKTLVREVYEETGFEAKITRKVGEYTFVKSGKVNHTFECVITGGIKTLSDESKAIEYFKTKDLPEMISPYVIVMIEDALKKDQNVIYRELGSLPISIWLKALMHPWALFKYLLTKFGIHWNT